MQHPILIVEDDVETREATQALLELYGYPVVQAANGAEGLDQLHGGLRPCLILLDLMMPVKDGFQFLAERRLDPALAEIPVIVCSGQSGEGDQAALRDAAAQLCKPVDVDRLLKLIDSLRTSSPPLKDVTV